MKHLIMYIYNLNDINIYKSKNKIYIKSKNKKYLFEKVYNEKRLIDAYNILQNKTEYYKIIKNIYNNIITEYNGNKYVLLEENTNHQVLSYNMYFDSKEYENISINHSNWEQLWTIKNDYYESHRTTNKYLNESKDYYLGLAENAIQFIKLNNIKNDKLTICRLKIIDELNPINVILDCKEREIAEIIKNKFFNENIDIKEIDNLINNNDIKKIIARLLYPNYYFDLYDQFINGKEDINMFRNIIYKSKSYEELIKYIYNKYGSNINMVDWLKKD